MPVFSLASAVKRLVALILSAVVWRTAAAITTPPRSNKLNVSLSILPSDTVNHTAVARFNDLRKMFERRYPKLGRVPQQAPANGLTIDFEVETLARVRLTPELLLLRGGIDLRTPPPAGVAFVKDSSRPAFLRRGVLLPEDVSEWFSVTLDGTGTTKNGPFRQDLSGQIELESVVMRPNDVLTSTFTEDVAAYLKNMGRKRTNALLPGTSHVYFDNGVGASVRCQQCHVQWTLGIGLPLVPKLLWQAGHRGLRGVLRRVQKICSERQAGCTPNYQGFISLAAWALHATHMCKKCSHMKRCMQPWLVRTHLGDLASYTRDAEDPESWKQMPAEILEAANIGDPNAPLILDGVIDYLHFAEMAEYVGAVHGRDSTLAKHTSYAMDVPTDASSLLVLAQRMLDHAKSINRRLGNRGCGIFGKNEPLANGFSAKDWLEGLLHGKDIMSDHDSPISKNSFSHLVWKSMGSWRMRKSGGNTVYLECRNTHLCLATNRFHDGAPALIRYVGRTMLQFEREVLTEGDELFQRFAQEKEDTMHNHKQSLENNTRIVDANSESHLQTKQAIKGARLMRKEDEVQ